MGLKVTADKDRLKTDKISNSQVKEEENSQRLRREGIWRQ